MKNKLLYKTYYNKKVLVTGHTGFKGTWLTIWLKLLGAEVMGISLDIPSKPSHFEKSNISKSIKDIRMDINSKNLKKTILDFKPDFIFHLAAQALVNLSFEDPYSTWQPNVMGTATVLESLKSYNKKCTVILVTSDKCYDNKEWPWGYRETDQLGGSDPYSGSKAAVEILINSYVKSFYSNSKNLKIASVRAGNVIGGGDWSKDRIIPDIIKGWFQSKTIFLRNPSATRPWQHVLEPLSGYLSLAEKMYNNKNFIGEAYNFGPSDNQINTVTNVVGLIKKYLPKKSLSIRNGTKNNKEHHLLKLNCDKALSKLKWRSTLDFNETIDLTINWYLLYYKNPKKTYDITTSQINLYTKLAFDRKIHWAK